MNLEEARQLQHGQILRHTILKNADGTPQRWRVNGKVTTWKTRPNEIRVPLKRGLYQYYHLDHFNLDEFEREQS